MATTVVEFMRLHAAWVVPATFVIAFAESLALVSLFVIQLALAFFYQATPEREIAVLTALAWVYLALAVILLVWHARRVPALARAAFGTVPQAE